MRFQNQDVICGLRCLALFVMVLSSIASAETTITGSAFGTSYTVKIIDAEPFSEDEFRTSIQARLEQIDRCMSTYRDDSDVSLFNHADAGAWFAVSDETAFVVELAQAISKQTEGAFDITVGPAVALWNFGASSSREFRLPTDGQIASTMNAVGYEKLEVRMDPPALRKTVAELQIDLSAIAKGYAVDAVSELLADFDGFMVEIGGEVRVRGARRDGSPWRIGLEAPTRNDRRVDSIISLRDEAMATSGDYRSFHDHEGVTYSHTIDPQTCSPVKHRLGSVTILADDCATADALATAVLVMGPIRGHTWAEVNAVRAMLVSQDDNGLSRIRTPGFPEIDVQPSAADEKSAGPRPFVGMFIATTVVFGLAVLAMSIGTIVANRRLQGSCGGMAGLKDAGGKTICDMCTKPSPECAGEPQTVAAVGTNDDGSTH